MVPVVSLVGLPGGGKSTVGRQLARRIGARFLDSDIVLEERIGMPIRSYFEQHGEQAFRDLEEAILDELTQLQGEPLVLATGGGSCLREVNRQHLRDRSTVIYLRSSPEELFRRLRHDTQRPLLQVADPLAKLRDLHEVRHPLYQAAAHYAVDTGRPSVSSLVGMIIAQLEVAGLLPAQPSSVTAGTVAGADASSQAAVPIHPPSGQS